jgi:hypothetical protein
MTYVDENGASVYGQRIRNLGESQYHQSVPFPDFLMVCPSKCRVAGSILSPSSDV